MRRLTLLFGALLLLAATVNAQTRYYVAIDLGSSGTKAMLYSFKDGAPDVASERIINTKLVSSMTGTRFTSAGIDDAANAAKELVTAMKAKAAEQHADDVDAYIVGSSAVAKAENKDELVAAVKKATGLELQFVDARQEAYFGVVSAVPRKNRPTAILVDIGSGNTKLGCLVGEPTLSNFKSAEIPFGSKSGRNAALKKDAGDIRAGMRKVIEDDVRPAFVRESMDAPCLRNRHLIYWTGGAAWATATFMHPEDAKKSYVKLTRKDLEQFMTLLSNGSWNQKALVYHFAAETPARTREAIRTLAEKQKNDVMNVFVREDLLSGLSIMTTVLDESNPSSSIYFVRNGNYIYGYARDKYHDD